MQEKRGLLWELFPLHLAIVVVSLTAACWYLAKNLTHYCNALLIENLKSQNRTISKLIETGVNAESGPELDRLLKELKTQITGRITISSGNGTPLADSQQDVSKIVNYSGRAEIKDTLESKEGVSMRYSVILDANMLYVACPIVRDGTVIGTVRTTAQAVDLSTITENLPANLLPAALCIALLAALLHLYASYNIVRPVKAMRKAAAHFASGDLLYKVDVPDSKEFAALAVTMNNMAAQLHARLRTVTEQRNELETVLSGMVEAVMVVDTNEKIVNLNRAAEKLFGLEYDRIKGKSVQEAIRNTDLHRFVSKTLSGSNHLEGDIMFLGDPEKFLQAHGAILKDAQNIKTGALIVLNDVTRLKTLENIRRDFVANVSHELKTPVTSIKGFLETLREGAMDDAENSKRFLDIIIRHTDRLNSIIEDLLSLSRIERDSEKGEISVSEHSLKDVLDTVIKACNKKAKLKDIEVRLDMNETLIADVNATLLEQALTNLVDNAIKYSEPGKMVELKAAGKGEEIIIAVKDQGSGIPKEHLSRIFERFYRVDKARSRKVGGTGLGLSIVKHIVNAHGGRVTVESSPGRGSTFSIHLPKHSETKTKKAKQ